LQFYSLNSRRLALPSKIRSKYRRIITFIRNEANEKELECGPMPNVMAALPNIGGGLCSMPQSLADARCWSAVQ